MRANPNPSLLQLLKRDVEAIFFGSVCFGIGVYLIIDRFQLV